LNGMGMASLLRIGGTVVQNWKASDLGQMGGFMGSGGWAHGTMDGEMGLGLQQGARGLIEEIPSALRSNFLFAGAFSAVSNLWDFVTRKETGKQALVGFGVDTAAYTGIGTVSTWLGGAVGSLLGPLGTIGGLVAGGAVGVGLGWLYEKFVRPVAMGLFNKN